MESVQQLLSHSRTLQHTNCYHFILTVTEHWSSFSLKRIKIDELKITFTSILTLVTIIKKKISAKYQPTFTCSLSTCIYSEVCLRINICGVRLWKSKHLLIDHDSTLNQIFQFSPLSRKLHLFPRYHICNTLLQTLHISDVIQFG